MLILICRYQRVVLNGKKSEWKRVNAGVPQGSNLGHLFFLIYINDLPVNLESKPKIFADDASLFSLVLDQLLSLEALNRDLSRISEWARKWKMSFNPDRT
uniref:Reverse transcriptase domain-containing protein n=1 Tax=Clytia hemisphaerica TaxID=252671 RepID=A0A7M5X4D9_9CNID|eukprot:TCONS_00004823-protein